MCKCLPVVIEKHITDGERAVEWSGGKNDRLQVQLKQKQIFSETTPGTLNSNAGQIRMAVQWVHGMHLTWSGMSRKAEKMNQVHGTGVVVSHISSPIYYSRILFSHRVERK